MNKKKLALTLSGCNGSSQTKIKDMYEIEKLTKEQFAEATAAIYVDVFQQMDNLLDKYTKIDSKFEKDIDELQKSMVGQMVEYGKILAKKDVEMRDDFITSCLTTSLSAMEKLGPEVAEGFEKKFDKRLPELQAYGCQNLERKFDDLFAIMDFLDLERIKEERPESAKEFGVE